MARVICPACKKAGDVPDEFLGRRIKCPNCDQRFAAPTLPPPRPARDSQPQRLQRKEQRPRLEPDIIAAVTEPDPVAAPSPRPAVPAVPTAPSPPAPADIAAAPPVAPAAATTATKRCIYCGEEVLAVALKCKHCGEFLDPAIRAAEEAKELARLAHTRAGPSVQQVVSINQIDTSPRHSQPHKNPWWLAKFGLILLGSGVVLGLLVPVLGAILLLCGFGVFVVGLIAGAGASL